MDKGKRQQGRDCLCSLSNLPTTSLPQVYPPVQVLVGFSEDETHEGISKRVGKEIAHQEEEGHVAPECDGVSDVAWGGEEVVADGACDILRVQQLHLLHQLHTLLELFLEFALLKMLRLLDDFQDGGVGKGRFYQCHSNACWANLPSEGVCERLKKVVGIKCVRK